MTYFMLFSVLPVMLQLASATVVNSTNEYPNDKSILAELLGHIARATC